MDHIAGAKAVGYATLSIRRAATGLTEDYQVVLHAEPTVEPHIEPTTLEETSDGADPSDRS